MTAFLNHLSFEFRTGTRDRNQLLMNYLFPLGIYLLLGLLMTQLNPPFRQTLIPAMILISIMSSTVLGLPNPLVAAREAGIFRSYKINSVPAISILGVPTLTTLLHVIIVAAIITATAPLIFEAPLPENWLAFVMTFLLSAIAMAGLGMLISVISSSTQAVVLWSQLIFLPSMMIGGLMIPFGMLPASLAKLGIIFPATHAMNLFQGWAANQNTGLNSLWSAMILLAGGILPIGLATYLFNWDSQNVTRRGHPALALLVALPYAAAILLTF